MWMPALVQGTRAGKRPVCITASSRYSIQLLQNLLSDTYCPPLREPFLVHSWHGSISTATELEQLHPFSDIASFWPCALLHTYRSIARPYPVLSATAVQTQNIRFVYCNTVSLYCRNWENLIFFFLPPQNTRDKRTLSCLFLRQNSKHDQLLLHALWLITNAKTRLLSLIPKKCL